MNDTHASDAEHVVPYRTYINVWLVLVLLTGITVGASLLDLKHLSVFAALLIASVKSTLVLLYFMHLRYEKPIFGIMFSAVIFTYAIFIILTFADYAFRVA